MWRLSAVDRGKRVSRINNWLPMALMFALAALTLWMQFSIESEPAKAPSGPRHDPDAIVENMVLKRLTDRGDARFTLKARRLMHFPNDDTTELEYPELVQLKLNQPSVTVSAERGKLLPRGGNGEDEAFFYGNVVLVQSATREQPELRVRTQSLQVLVDREQARTSDRVTVSQGKSQMTGVGMDFDRRTNRVSLHSQVKGTYDVPRR